MIDPKQMLKTATRQLVDAEVALYHARADVAFAKAQLSAIIRSVHNDAPSDNIDEFSGLLERIMRVDRSLEALDEYTANVELT